MVQSTKNLEGKFIPLFLTQKALNLARQFADQQPTPEKKKQVYLNTLAVCAVNDYLEMMDVATDLGSSDSWNPAMRFYADVADLKLFGLGHLECRPIASDNHCYVPPEVPDNRLGIVVVKIDTNLQQATLIGFAKEVQSGELSINELQSVDDLLIHLDYLEFRRDQVNLSQWLENIFATGWQPVEEILAPKAPQLAFRYTNGVTRGKLVDLGIQLPNKSVALVVTLTPKNLIEIQLKFQVHPTAEQAYLPNNLSVRVLDEQGVTVMEAYSRSASTYITLEFNAQTGERFSINLELGDTEITENFVV